MLLTLVIVYLLWSPLPLACMRPSDIKNTADFAIAGRNLPLVMIVTTTFTTWFRFEKPCWAFQPSS